MSEDKKEVEETTEEETLEENEDTKLDADQDEQDDSSEDESEDEESDDEGDDVEDEIDYKAQLEEAQGRLAQQNERIAKQDKKIIKLKKKSKVDEFGDEIEEEDEEEEDLDAKVDAKLTARMASLREDIIDEAIEAVSSNADEAKLIRWHFDNTLNVKGFSKKEIVENVSFAKAIANKGKIDIKNKIISKKIKSINSSGVKSTTGIPPKKSPKVTQYDRQMADRYFKGDIKKWLKYKT